MRGAALIAAASLVAASGASAQAPAAGAGRHGGGRDREFRVEATGLAAAWPVGGPRPLWGRPRGTGHSAIVAEDGRLYTLDRVGNGRTRGGPFDAEESVIALDAATGRTLWE